jgi:excisionase family DNA binding protein
MTLLLERAEYIIIDGMPVLIGPDASILSNLANATTVVISAGKTTRSVLTKSLENLNRFGTGNLVGVIFNRIDLKRRYHYNIDYYYSPQALPTQKGTNGKQAPKPGWKRLLIPWLTPPDKENEYLSVAEVAAYLGLGEQTVRRWCADGRLPAQKHRWRWWIRQKDVELVASRHSIRTGQDVAEKTSHQQLVEELLAQADVDPSRNGLEQETERKPKHSPLR